MKFSVFTASTPEWSPEHTVRVLADQGGDGVEWRITDQEPADVPGGWAGNRATWPLTGLEDSIPDMVRVTRDAGLEFSGIGGYLAHVHVKNARWVPTGETGYGGDVLWSEEWTPLRDGQASDVAYFEALADVGYDDWATVEDFSTTQPLAKRLADNLSFLRAVRERVNNDRVQQSGGRS